MLGGICFAVPGGTLFCLGGRGGGAVSNVQGGVPVVGGIIVGGTRGICKSYTVETWMTMVKLNKAMAKVLRHGLKNKEDGDDEEIEEDGNHIP